LLFGEEKKTSEIAGKYINSVLPGIMMYGLLDIDRSFITSFGKSNIAFSCQIFSPFIHLAICYTFVILLKMGVVGAGYAMFLTNLIVYIA